MNRTARVLAAIAGVCLLTPSASANPAVAAGIYHVLLLTNDGTVRSWGNNVMGALGDGTTINRWTAVTVYETPPPNTSPSTPLSNVVAIAACEFASFALKADGTLWSWGSSTTGELGDASVSSRSTASPIPGLSNVIAVATGRRHVLALKSDGTVWVWGSNAYGQLGDGTASSVPIWTPTQITALGTDVQAIGAGSSSQNSYAIKTDGTIWAWGTNQYGTFGNGTASYSPSAPVQTTGLTAMALVASGDTTTYGASATGQLSSWGDDQWGQLGDGGSLRQYSPVTITSMASVAALGSGDEHGLAALTDGTVWAWGWNAMGQVGNGTTTDSHIPVLIAGPQNVVSVSGGGLRFSVAVSNDGRVWTWGYNQYGQLGDGTNWGSTVPLEIFAAGFTPHTARPLFSIPTGTYTTTLGVTVTSDSPGATIHYTMNGADPTTNDPAIPSGAAVSVTSTTTLKAKAYVDGMPESNVQIATYTLKPVTPTLSPSGGTFTSATNVTITTTTSGSTIRYTTDGSTPTATSTLYAGPVSMSTTGTLKAVAFKTGWADSAVAPGAFTFNFGPLNTPTANPTGGTYEGQVVVTLSADSGATIRYTTNGADPIATSTAYTQPLTFSTTTTLKAKAFQTDHPTSATMTQVYTIRAATPTFTLTSGSYDPGAVVTINGDASTTLRITLSGVDPTNTDPTIPTGTSLLVGGYTIKVRAFKTNNTDSNVASATYSLTSPLGGGAVTAGSSHTVLATPGGLVYAWGLNSSGQVGDSTNNQRSTPKLISTLTGVTKLAAGSLHTLAVTWDGRLFAWGNDGSGRLGDGLTTNVSTPKWISAISNVVAVAAGASHSLALTANGQVYAWGAGSNGQLGLGNTSPANTPTLITTLNNIVAIGAGDNQSFAVTSSGQLYAWGYNGSSQLGDGGTTQQTSPKLITGISGVASVTGGTSHTVAHTASGSVYTWGANSNGQLGQGNTNAKTTPTLVSGLSVGALVSSGSAFAAAVRSDSVLVGWGLNSSYQLGTTTPSQQTAPTVVPSGPASVALLSTGTTHTVAVTPDGHVWTWGNDFSGQLGDGNSGSGTNRATPLDVFASAGAWGATPAPMLTLAPGTYHSTQTLSASAMSGATVHYTATGATPTEADPVLVSGATLPIDQNITYGFRAFTPGLLPSAPVVAAYELQPLAPTISPASGTYTSAQSVTLQAQSGTTIRYTLDGSVPTTQSTAYTGAISLGVPLTVTARAFRSGWTTSTSAAAAYSFVLGAPTINPPGGLYTTTQSVTLQAAPGATIRYTTDGSAPNANSPIYAGAFPVASSLTVRAIASEAGWADSPGNSQTYTIDSVGPVIAATYFPSPNSAGWNHGPVEVSFFCTDAVTGVQTCPQPVTFSAEGGGQQATVTATDAAGNQSATTITVNIDLTPATVVVNAPANPSATTDTSITVTAAVSDNLSGLSTAKCNGTSTTISNGAITCQVALQTGVNPVIVLTQDVAGNVSSVSVNVTRNGTATSIEAVPSQYALSVGQTVSIRVIDDFGQPVAVGNWTTSDSGIADVDANGVVSAIAIGEATITATAGSLSADVQVTVLAAGPLPVGTTRWTVAPSPGYVTWNTVGMNRSDSTLFAALEVIPDGQGGVTAARMRGIDAVGQETFSLQVPIPPGDIIDRIIGDAFGGALVMSQHDVIHSNFDFTITRVAPDGPGWQHQAERIDGLAQAPDGTIFALVRALNTSTNDLSIRGIDGQTGTVKFDIPLKPWSYTLIDSGCPSANYQYLEGPDDAGTITIDTNGYANILAIRDNWVEERNSDLPNCGFVHYNRSENTKVLLERVSTTGAVTELTLAEYTDPSAVNDVDAPWDSQDFIVGFHLGFGKPGSILPDDQGGVLANWSVCRQNYLYQLVNCDYRARYIDNGTPASEYSLPSDSTELATVTGSGRIAYRGGSSVTAFHVESGSPIWTVTVQGTPTAALDGGGVAVFAVSSSSGVLVDSSGQLIASGLPNVGVNNAIADQWIGITSGQVSSTIAREAPIDKLAGMPLQNGNSQGQNAPPIKYYEFEPLAVTILDQLLPITWMDGEEFGGRICRTPANSLFWTTVKGYTERDSNGTVIRRVTPIRDCPSSPISTTSVAVFHTHVESNHPSPADLSGSQEPLEYGSMFYLEAPCRTVTRWNYLISQLNPPYEVVRLIDGCTP